MMESGRCNFCFVESRRLVEGTTLGVVGVVLISNMKSNLRYENSFECKRRGSIGVTLISNMRI